MCTLALEVGMAAGAAGIVLVVDNPAEYGSEEEDKAGKIVAGTPAADSPAAGKVDYCSSRLLVPDAP